MTDNESSALQYIAGYVCRHLHKKIERENHDLKEEMILCLVELVKDKTIVNQGVVCVCVCVFGKYLHNGHRSINY